MRSSCWHRAPQGGLDPADLLKPLADSWPSYSGDYTGRRYSALTQVNQSNVKQLTLAFAATLTGGPARRRQRSRRAPPTIIGGEGDGDVVVGGATQVKGAILSVNGVLYVTAPDNVWALDAHDGREIWHYFWKTKGGTHIGNRGVGDVGQLSLLRHARTTTSSRSTRARARSGGTRRSRRSASSTS